MPQIVYLLKLEGDIEELILVHEINQHVVKLGSPGAPDKLDERIVGLSWRWDIIKPNNLEDAKKIRSEKIRTFIKKARALGFQYAWVDWMCVPQYPDGDIMAHVIGSRSIYEKCSILIVDKQEVVPGLAVPTLDYMSRFISYFFHA
jgi:hypothetical protein